MTDARLEGAVAEVARAMKAHPNWSAPGYVITHDEIEAAERRHTLEEAVAYFAEHNPEYLKDVIAKALEGVRK